MKSVRSTGAGTVRHSSNISYAAGIFAVIIISSAISFSIYFHRLVKPTYFDFGYINNSSNSHSEYQNHSSTNYLPKTTTLVDFAGSILDAFSRNSPEEKAYCDNSTSIWCSIPIPAERLCKLGWRTCIIQWYISILQVTLRSIIIIFIL